ncbi:MAG: zinc-ribbon domain-containing protein [Chloroflexi bacterium]|nr:zinc-ribbon domain-containing protein [Chloroflexota bacterium]
MMQCPKCQAENREEVNFCEQCGAKMEVVCPNCEANIPLGKKFCGKCGHDLSVAPEPLLKPLSFDEKLDKIQRYLPGDLTGKILAQRGKIEGERRQVTVMFCDVEGFTPLSEKLGEEKLYSLIDELFEMMIHKVHDYGGTVNKGTGDGIMALFGTPIAVEDAPQRAIRSALAIQREMAKFSGTRKEETAVPPLRMRIGINTGPVVVGTLGNDLRVEFTAVGDTVNLASRMEGLAQPGTVCVTEDTFKLTEGFFRFEVLGERQVKGKEVPVKAYRVIAPSTSRTRFDVSAERGLTPFVGRQKELELLLDGLERAKAGRGQAFSIMGEAGVGKSRLLYEFRKAIANEDVTLLEGRCLSYSQNVAYHPVIELLKSNFGVREGDEDYKIRNRVKQGLKQLGVDEASTFPYLLELLGVKDSGIDRIPMSTEARRERTMEAVKRIPLKGSEVRPLIMAIEDLHWADRSSEEAMKDMLESIPGARILLIFTYRPEFVHTWGSRSYHSQVTLNRLSNRESLAMLANLLGTEEIETQLQELVLEKTEGVPFFIEEFIKSLKDLKIIEKKDSIYRLRKDIHDVTIPGTIQDVIMARVDSLPEPAKAVLQRGSAIEREFGFDLISRVSGLSQQELLSHLSALKDAELIYERGIYPRSTYIFRHALTREVVYNSILAARKKKLHLDIGDAIEEIYKDSPDEHYEALAAHYITGEQYEKGAEYCRLAARKGEKAASLNDAIVYGEKRVSCLERLPRSRDVEKQIIDTRATLGLYYAQMNHFVKAKEAIEPVVELALKRDHKRRLAQIYTIMGGYSYAIDEDFPKAFEYLEESLKLGEESNDMVSLVLSSSWMGGARANNCDFDQALTNWERTLEFNLATNNLPGMAATKSIMARWLYSIQGKCDLAYDTSNEALRLAEESGDTLSKALGHTSQGVAFYFKGFLDEAEPHLLKGSDFCDRINFLTWGSPANLHLGELYFDKGEYQKCQDLCGKTISLMEGRYASSVINFYRLALARAKVLNNEKGVDLESLYKYEAKNKYRYLDGWIIRYIAEILLNIDDRHISEAEEWVKKAIEADKRNGTMWDLGMAHSLYAVLLKRKGDLPGAREKLNKAIEIYKECGADGWLKKAQADLAAIEKPTRKRSQQTKG